MALDPNVAHQARLFQGILIREGMGNRPQSFTARETLLIGNLLKHLLDALAAPVLESGPPKGPAPKPRPRLRIVRPEDDR